MQGLTEKQQRQIEDYLEDRLSSGDRSRLEKWLEKDPAARDYLLFLKKLKEPSLVPPRRLPPPGLADKIMDRLGKPAPEPFRAMPWLRSGWASAALLVVLLVGLRLFYAPSPSKAPGTEVPLGLHAPGARSVEVVGDFTAWKPLPLQAGDGWWRIKIRLAAGRSYQYAFILNGDILILDPHQPEAVRDRRGDFYSVISLKDGKSMTRTSAVQLKSAAFLAACWAVLSPQPAMAETAPTGSSLSLLQKKCESAGLSASESKTLSAQAGKLEEEGLTDKTLVDLMDQSLSLGKGPAVQKSLDRVGFLLGQGLDPEEAGQVALKEVEATQKDQEKTLDQEMEKTLASGLPDHTATSKPVVLTQKELAEKLEQKREEWEERLEDQKRLEAIENDHLEQHK